MSSRRKNRRPSLKGSLNPSKRHRDRVNVELDNLAKLLPFPPDVISKLDKLSVLRLSASYLRTKKFFKGFETAAKTEENESNGSLSSMILEALDGFLMVLTHDGEIFYASETINEFLGVSQASVIHQDFLRFVHVDDQKLLLNNLQLVPSPPEQKIREISGDDSPNDHINSPENGEIPRERSFICRFKCILNTNAGFFKPFKCHGHVRKMDGVDDDLPQHTLFLICSPVEVSTSILEIRMKSMLFCTKNNLDLSFADIDQKGKQIVGYAKKDILSRSSYCMMHYDDVPVLKAMHQQLLRTGKCQGIFRWLNKFNKWQWINGSGQVVMKNGQPDFVLTTNKPLTDEEGEEEVRRREREHGMIPTSPANMLTHLKLAEISALPSTSSFPDLPVPTTNQPLDYSSLSGTLPTTSCTSEDLPWDSATDSLFEANKTSWDNNSSLADLEDIGKGDLVGELLHLDVNDINLDEEIGNAILGQDTTLDQPHLAPVNQPPPQIQPPQLGGYSHNDQQNKPSPVLTHELPRGDPPPYGYSPTQNGISSNNGGYQLPAYNQNSMISPNHDPYSMQATSVQNISPMKLSPTSMSNSKNMNCTYREQPSLDNVTNKRGQHWPPGNNVMYNTSSHGSGLLRVHTEQQPLNHTYIKPEPGKQTAGYYCNAPNMEQHGLSGMPGMNHVPLNAPHAPTNNRFRNRQLNHASFQACNSAPPSPYSSACSSSSSYSDGLHVQFSPTDVLTSPFASPRDDEYYHGNVGNASHGYTRGGGAYRVQQVARNRLPNGYSQSFVNVAEISPIGMVDELVTGLHHAAPVTSRTTGVTNW